MEFINRDGGNMQVESSNDASNGHDNGEGNEEKLEYNDQQLNSCLESILNEENPNKLESLEILESYLSEFPEKSISKILISHVQAIALLIHNEQLAYDAIFVLGQVQAQTNSFIHLFFASQFFECINPYVRQFNEDMLDALYTLFSNILLDNSEFIQAIRGNDLFNYLAFETNHFSEEYHRYCSILLGNPEITIDEFRPILKNQTGLFALNLAEDSESHSQEMKYDMLQALNLIVSDNKFTNAKICEFVANYLIHSSDPPPLFFIYRTLIKAFNLEEFNIVIPILDLFSTYSQYNSSVAISIRIYGILNDLIPMMIHENQEVASRALNCYAAHSIAQPELAPDVFGVLMNLDFKSRFATGNYHLQNAILNLLLQSMDSIENEHLVEIFSPDFFEKILEFIQIEEMQQLIFLILGKLFTYIEDPQNYLEFLYQNDYIDVIEDIEYSSTNKYTSEVAQALLHQIHKRGSA